MFPNHVEPLATEILLELNMNGIAFESIAQVVCAAGGVMVIWFRRLKISAEILVLFNYRIASLEGIIT